MAGGKETPRQKMIGMMYLVLTALLALNVSKSILDAFVAIEENMQKSNISQLSRGNELMTDVSSELASTTGAENAEKRAKLNLILAQMQRVDTKTATLIQEIDQLKLELLTESGEDVGSVRNNDEATILWEKGNGCKPARMHLMAVEAQDQYDIPMHILIGDDIKEPTGKGLKLWNDFNQYRTDLVHIVGTYQEGSKHFSIQPKAINRFKNHADLSRQVEQMILTSQANVRRDANGKVIDLGEDGQLLKDIYINLTKPERVKQSDVDGIHWIGQTFDHSPLVAALASLSSMQQDILSARAMALAHLKSKVTTGEFSFNSIVGLAYGPQVANAGEEVEVKVMMAAFDSDNQPTIQYNGASFRGTGGMGLIKTKVGSGNELVLSGMVSIKNKSGIEKKEPWSHTVKIMKPQGTISLPQMNVLYRGYENKVEGVASGYDQTILSGAGVNLIKKGGYYIASPNTTAKTVTISISGLNSVTHNKAKGLGGSRLRNLGDVNVWGGEAELTLQLTDELRVNFGYGDTHSEIKSDAFTSDGISLDGKELPFSNPTFNAGIAYDVGLGDYGDLRLQGDYSWKDDHYFKIDNSDTAYGDAYGITNVQLIWTPRQGNYQVELHGENIFDEEYYLYAGEIYTNTQNIVWGKPAWWGIKFSYTY